MIILQTSVDILSNVIYGAAIAMVILTLWAAISDYFRSGPARDSKGRFTTSKLDQALPLVRIVLLALAVLILFRIITG